MADIGRCRNCRFWAKSLGEKVDNSRAWSGVLASEWGWCLAMLSGSHVGRDGCPPNPLDGGLILAEANDDEGYLATIATAPDFGCVMFEAKAELS